MNQNAGNIVRRSTVFGNLQQTLAALALFFSVNHFKEDLLLIDDIAQAIGTQQQAIASFKLFMEKVAIYLGFCADGTGDQILAGVGFGLLRGSVRPYPPSAGPGNGPR